MSENPYRTSPDEDADLIGGGRNRGSMSHHEAIAKMLTHLAMNETSAPSPEALFVEKMTTFLSTLDDVSVRHQPAVLAALIDCQHDRESDFVTRYTIRLLELEVEHTNANFVALGVVRAKTQDPALGVVIDLLYDYLRARVDQALFEYRQACEAERINPDPILVETKSLPRRSPLEIIIAGLAPTSLRKAVDQARSAENGTSPR